MLDHVQGGHHVEAAVPEGQRERRRADVAGRESIHVHVERDPVATGPAHPRHTGPVGAAHVEQPTRPVEVGPRTVRSSSDLARYHQYWGWNRDAEEACEGEVIEDSVPAPPMGSPGDR